MHFLWKRKSGEWKDSFLNASGKEKKAEVRKHDQRFICTKLTMLDFREMLNHPQMFVQDCPVMRACVCAHVCDELTWLKSSLVSPR